MHGSKEPWEFSSFHEKGQFGRFSAHWKAVGCLRGKRDYSVLSNSETAGLKCPKAGQCHIKFPSVKISPAMQPVPKLLWSILLCYCWRFPHSMWCRVYVMCGCLSVPSIIHVHATADIDWQLSAPCTSYQSIAAGTQGVAAGIVVLRA